MTAPRVTPGRVGLIAIAILVLAAASTIAVAASVGALHRSTDHVSTSCASPTLPGNVVDVSLVDMAGMGGMRGGQNGWRSWHPGMMRVHAQPQAVTSGTVSLRVRNLGVIKHELVVLPLASGQQPGSRAVGNDGKVSEAGSLGEASASCASGSGDGLVPGTTGWVTITLAPGRYELVCNFPGHYAAGMYAELDVT